MNSNPRPTTVSDVHALLVSIGQTDDAYFRILEPSGRTAYLLGMCEAKLAEAYRELNRLETAHDPRRI